MSFPKTARGKRLEAEAILDDLSRQLALAQNLLSAAQMQERESTPPLVTAAQEAEALNQ